MPRYRKKPVVIEALQWLGDNMDEILRFLGEADAGIGDLGRAIFIKTLEGDMRADLGDYVIRGVQGEFYPCKPDIFEATYELVA